MIDVNLKIISRNVKKEVKESAREETAKNTHAANRIHIQNKYPLHC